LRPLALLIRLLRLCLRWPQKSMYCFVKKARVQFIWTPICFVSFSTHKHYNTLRLLAKYLRMTVDWGILYWHQEAVSTLPVGPIVPLSMSDKDAEEPPPFPSSDPMRLIGLVDAAYGTGNHRRSVTGIILCLLVAPLLFAANPRMRWRPRVRRQNSLLLSRQPKWPNIYVPSCLNLVLSRMRHETYPTMAEHRHSILCTSRVANSRGCAYGSHCRDHQ
jgi:hypothetical protein